MIYLYLQKLILSYTTEYLFTASSYSTSSSVLRHWSVLRHKNYFYSTVEDDGIIRLLFRASKRHFVFHIESIANKNYNT